MTQIVLGLLMAPSEGGSPMVALIVQFGLIFLIFYWLLIRPQRKEKERHEQMISGLKKGDEITTVGGIIGTIVHLSDDRVTVKTGDNTRLIIERGKVSQLARDESKDKVAG